MANEADTCRKYVLPKIYKAGWSDDQISEQYPFTAGRIVTSGGKVWRKKCKRADYLLRYNRDLPLAIVEAKASHKLPGDGLQQAKDYAETLGLKFVYSTNGKGVVEFDYTTGSEREVEDFPTPDELWCRLRGELRLTNDDNVQRFLEPYNLDAEKPPRYYQTIAINKVIEAVLAGKKRNLLTLATGTGKTSIAFQICWKLWKSHWNAAGTPGRRPRILFLADLNILVADPKDKDFTPFGDARHKIGEGGSANEPILSREMYFAIYQAIAADSRRPGLYRSFPRDFFDLIIVDECHRGSARDDSNWREILEWFEPAFQLGMTATPLREDNRDTYLYFGNPLYTYSLKQGIEDGFLAPYRLRRIVTSIDATGYRPQKGEKDEHGREIPDGLYTTKDFDRTLTHKNRTKAIARHLKAHLENTSVYDKTMVFCTDQEHAEQMRHELSLLFSEMNAKHPDYVARVTSDEGKIGKGHLGRFMDPENETPVILTTSKMLTTGVDAQTTKNIVIVRTVESMPEFKQIIGRGTRVREDSGKLWFSILDYTGSASRKFADPDFDGEPALITEEEIDEDGETLTEIQTDEVQEETPEEDDTILIDEVETGDDGEETNEPRKLVVKGEEVGIAIETVSDLAADGTKLQTVELTAYTGRMVRAMFTNVDKLREKWSREDERRVIAEALHEKGIDLDALAAEVKRSDADPFDILSFLAFDVPLLTRRQRAEMARRGKEDLFSRYGKEAEAILLELLDKYIEHGIEQLRLPHALDLPPIDRHGTPVEIIDKFGGVENLQDAIKTVQNLIYQAEI